MLKNLKIVGVIFLLFFGFTLVSFQPGLQIVQTAWSETNASSDIQKEDPIVDSVQSWGAFRGWSPSIPYGENSSNRTNQLNSTNKPLADINISTSKNEKKPNVSSISGQSPVSEDVEESWGAFRGWSPAVPYGN